MSLTRSFNRMVAKATYDPELEKQLAAERAKSREARGKFRETIDSSMKRDNELVISQKLTPQGATQSAALFKTMNDYLASNPDLSSDEIYDKQQEFLDKLNTIYREDSNRIYFYNVLKSIDYTLLQLKNQNRISEDEYTKCKKILEKQQSWLQKNPNETAQVYNDKIQKLIPDIQSNLKDPELSGKILEAKNNVEKVDNTKEIQEKLNEAEAINRRKEQLEKQQFNPERLAKKTAIGITQAFLIAFLLVFGILGGALASNEAIARPLAYRILYFIYGFLFSPFVILYFIYKYITGHPPFFGSFLIPLFEYDPTTTKKDSFLERLVWFKTSPIILQARKSFQDAADAMKDKQLDFSKIAKEIAKE